MSEQAGSDVVGSADSRDPSNERSRRPCLDEDRRAPEAHRGCQSGPRPVSVIKRGTWRIGTALVLGIGMGLVAGCGSPSTEQRTSSQPSEPVIETTAAQSSTPEPTPTQESAGPSISGTAQIKDADGYSFDVVYQYQPSRVDKDIASEKPGFNSVVLQLHAEITLVNTTSGRDITFESVSGITAPLSDPKISLVGLWPSTSRLCRYAVQGGGVAGDSTKCGVVLAFVNLDNTLGAEQTMEPTVYAGAYGRRPGLVGVPDKDVDAVTTGIAHPESYILAYSANDNRRFASTCPNIDLESYLDEQWMKNYVTYNLYNSGYMPIYSPSNKCASNRFASQPQAE